MHKMIRLDTVIERFFISPSLRKDAYLVRKAKIFCYIQLLLIFVSIFSSVITTFYFQENKNVYTLEGAFIAMGLLYVFKITSNFILVGNIFSGAYFFVVAPSVEKTGGLFSDNLLWLMITPLVALLLANKRSGALWLLVLVAFTLNIYQKNIYHSLYFDNSAYYLISYLILFIVLFGIVWIFENGQNLIVKMLNEQKQTLIIQKEEILRKNEELKAIEEKLKQTNFELENFAYAASHDLKEPLRMIGMYSQLSQRRMNTLGVLDDRNTEYVAFMQDGVTRMQKLLDDLLQYSRLGKVKEDLKEVDLNNILFIVIHNLMANMGDSEASIIATRLPVVKGSSTEMVQIFQNLISNAIKFRKKGVAPQIQILAEEQHDTYVLHFFDNGIGIKQEYHDKIFNIFEKLHSRYEFEGSGIGLATVKKIITNSGGKIWLTSEEGEGTAFHITLPKDRESSLAA